MYSGIALPLTLYPHFMMSMCSTYKIEPERTEMLSQCWASITIVLVQAAQWYSQREWYLISPAIADKQMDLLCLECSLGVLHGLRYKDTAFVMGPAQGIIRPFGEWTKHGVKGTQKHTCSYTQSISQWLFLYLSSLFFPLHLFLSCVPINWPLYYGLP